MHKAYAMMIMITSDDVYDIVLTKWSCALRRNHPITYFEVLHIRSDL